MKKALEILKEILHFQDMSWQVEEKINAAIAEIEEAMKPKSCETCIHRNHLDKSLVNKVTNGFCVENGFFTKYGFCCNRYEPKDTPCA